MHDPMDAPLAPAAQAPGGMAEAAWEDAIRLVVQQRLELAVLPLAIGVPDMLTDGGGGYARMDVTLTLPGGERLRFTAELRLAA